MRAGFLGHGVQEAREPALELEPVDQPGQRVVGGLVGDLLRDAPLLGHVMQYQHDAGDAAVVVAQRGSRGIDEQFSAVAALEQMLVAEFHQRVAQQALADQIERPGTLHFMRDVAQVAERAAEHLRRLHAEQRLGHRVQVLDEALGIGRDHCITDRGQRDLDAPLLAA